jgi:hypothetical protein
MLSMGIRGQATELGGGASTWIYTMQTLGSAAVEAKIITIGFAQIARRWELKFWIRGLPILRSGKVWAVVVGISVMLIYMRANAIFYKELGFIIDVDRPFHTPT